MNPKRAMFQAKVVKTASTDPTVGTQGKAKANSSGNKGPVLASPQGKGSPGKVKSNCRGR